MKFKNVTYNVIATFFTVKLLITLIIFYSILAIIASVQVFVFLGRFGIRIGVIIS